MLESITVTGHSAHPTCPALDIGTLVEAMLYYGRVTVIVDRQMLEDLFVFFEEVNFCRVLDEGFLRVEYKESMVGVRTDSQDNGEEHHEVISCYSPDHLFHDELEKICIGARGRKGAGRRLARKLRKSINVSRSSPEILAGAESAILNPKYLKSAMDIVLRELVPDYPLDADAEFSATKTAKGIEIVTDLDFQKINRVHHEKIPPSFSSITPAYILSHIVNLEEDLFFSAKNQSDIACSYLSSRLAQNKIDYTVHHSDMRQRQIGNFQEHVLGNAKAVKEAVNQGRCNASEIIHILANARKFKDWIGKQSSDADLVGQYFDEIGQCPIIKKFPAKTIRFVIFQGLSTALGPVGNFCLSLGDMYLVDRILEGWKPNQFINRHVKPFCE